MTLCRHFLILRPLNQFQHQGLRICTILEDSKLPSVGKEMVPVKENLLRYANELHGLLLQVANFMSGHQFIL